MQQLTDILRFITISHIGVILFLFWQERQQQKGTGVCLFFGASIIGYLLADWQPMDQYPWVHTFLLVLPFSATVAFWLFSKLLFDDNFQWRHPWWWLLAGVLAVCFTSYFQRKLHFLPLPHSLNLLLGLTIQLISLTFILLGILEAARSRQDDLVLSRLQFRSIFIFVAALLMAVTALTEVSLDGKTAPPVLDLLQKAAIAGLTLFFTLNRLAFLPGFLPKKEAVAVVETLPAESAAKEVVADESLLEQLSEMMDQQKTWRNEGLTIRLLAEKLGVKEYRLRQTINQHLGYRNFNDYLNSYRIREACALLADPAKKELTVLEIAYDLGYASLAPFNKAFKDITGMTPTEWRKKHV